MNHSFEVSAEVISFSQDLRKRAIRASEVSAEFLCFGQDLRKRAIRVVVAAVLLSFYFQFSSIECGSLEGRIVQ